jgi:hypothetical protein
VDRTRRRSTGAPLGFGQSPAFSMLEKTNALAYFATMPMTEKKGFSSWFKIEDALTVKGQLNNILFLTG